MKERHEPKMSVITICFNSEKTVRRTLESMKNQTYKNVEYIIVDGVSTDRTLNIINEYKENIDVLISEKDHGIYDAFNKGLKYATGDVISILNSDDWYEENTLEIVAKYILENKEINRNYIVCSEMKRWFDNQNFSILPLNISSRNTENMFNNIGVGHPATFVSKGVYELIGKYNTEYRISADSDFLIRAFLNEKVTFYPIYLSLVNMEDGGVSSNPSLFMVKLKERFKMRKKYISSTSNVGKFLKELIVGSFYIIAGLIIKKLNLNFIYSLRNKKRIQH